MWCCRSDWPGFVCFVVINPRVLSTNKVDSGFSVSLISPPPPWVIEVVGLFKGWVKLGFVFGFLSSFSVFIAHVCYCLSFLSFSTFTPILFILPRCGGAEATGLGSVCFVVINPCLLSANRVVAFLFHKFPYFIQIVS